MSDEESFPGQRADEKIIISAGKHWYLLVWPLIKVFLGLVVVFVVLRFLGASIYFKIAFFLWAGLGLTYFIMTYIIWSKTRYFVTDQRIIIKRQKTLFAKEITEIDLANIHKVTYQVSGATSAAFQFGNISIQSYGSPEALVLESVTTPNKIQEKISLLISENIKEEEEAETSKKISAKGGHPKKYVPRAPRIHEG